MSDLLRRKETHFILWRPRESEPPPKLVIGSFEPGNPPKFINERSLELRPSPDMADLWELPVSECGLQEGGVYHYWFEIKDSNPYKSTHPKIRCTDPTAWTVDWRILSPRMPDESFDEKDRDPAGVVKMKDTKLIACDPGGEIPDWSDDGPMDKLPQNNRIVIYLLPTSWSRIGENNGLEIGVGSFSDIYALIERDAEAANFYDTRALERGKAHLLDLGINTIELLPVEDSWTYREWGYATSNYFAPDHDLGFPVGNLSPTPTVDLAGLIKKCHQYEIRFFTDMVMAFAARYPYQNINFLDFNVQKCSGDPEEEGRQDFGGDLFKYNYQVPDSYDPVTGQRTSLFPARALMRTHLTRWMKDFRIDGIRMDSIPNIKNWDFIEEFKDHARELWKTRWSQESETGTGDDRFIVFGEDLNMNFGLIRDMDGTGRKRLDAIWNEHFKHRVRCAILGEGHGGDNFEWTVRKMVDCTLAGFGDGAEAINYIGSHDVEGYRNERIYNLLDNTHIYEKEQRIKLAFACLLTAVGIPMIFAGDEFADRHDLPSEFPEKQVDPVNYDRMQDPWRKRVYDYVSRLVRLRTSYTALTVNDTRFIHVDFNEGKRVLAWERGKEGDTSKVVVVANFSDYMTPDPFSGRTEYFVHNWPVTPHGMHWKEVSQERNIPSEWVGREPIFPWEAKVYALFRQ